MGWTFTYKDRGMSIKKFFEKEFNRESEKYNWKIIDCAVVNMREAYIAIKRIDKINNSKEIYAVVCLLQYQPNDYFGYKNMSETMGPYYYNCPERILKLLTPTNNTLALEWREKCWQNIKERQQRPKLKEGMKIKFEKSIQFTDKSKHDTFMVYNVRKHWFRSEEGKIYHIPPKHLKNFKIIV